MDPKEGLTHSGLYRKSVNRARKRVTWMLWNREEKESCRVRAGQG